jgi:choline dehydrogenase
MGHRAGGIGDVSESFDYVIVGAGSAGCVLANRLSADPTTSVLLLEAGPEDKNPWIHVPIGYYRTIFNPAVAGNFVTEPEPELGGRSINWPRGRVLGGSSSINGLAYVRGQAEDYDHWRQLGNPGWAWDDVLPAFKKLEDSELGDPALRGKGGPLRVSGPIYRSPLMDAFIEAAEATGIPRNPDYNGTRQDGVAYFQLTIKGGKRCSAAVAYLKDIRGRSNLKIATGALATGVRMQDGRAVGVDYLQDGAQRTAEARGEVVLAAGAIQSPQLLLLSGIGPDGALKAHGIARQHELPGVGQNLQDHFQARAVYRAPFPATLNDVGNSLWRRGLAGLQWGLFKTGPLTMGAGCVALFWKTREELATPDVQFHVIPFSADKPGEPLHPFSGYTVSVCQLRPESRGELTLRSADPTDPPVIHANYLATETDRQTMVDGMKLIRRVMGQAAMRPYIAEEVVPGASCADDAALLGFVRSTGGTIFHPSGTCKMGPADDRMAVVDARLRVHGVAGLRVADASIMPTVISGNTNAPTIMIGEKAAEMILADAKA